MEYAKTPETDVPPHRNRGMATRPWGEFAAVLKADPGEWYEVQEHGMKTNACQVYASRIRNGGLTAFEPRGAFEARHEGTRLFARYVGDPS